MTGKELVYEVTKKIPMPRKDVEAIIKTTPDEIGKALVRGEKIQLIGFGTFQIREHVARVGRNPRTGEVINLPASKYVAFTPGKPLKAAVNGNDG